MDCSSGARIAKKLLMDKVFSVLYTSSNFGGNSRCCFQFVAASFSFMMVLSTITIFCIVPAIVGIAIGLGAVYADFKSENPAQVVTSFGGCFSWFLVFV